MAKIGSAREGTPPALDGTMVSVAAALAGVLGSAFALVIGIPTREEAVNQGLRTALETTTTGTQKAIVLLRRIFSLEPGGSDRASVPMSAGIWIYATVGTAFAVTYFLNQDETPPEVKGLAVAFAGYVVALMTAAYGLTPRQE
jgi:hypothetical protein